MDAERKKVVVILYGAGGCADILGNKAIAKKLGGPPGKGPPGDVLGWLQDKGWQMVASHQVEEYVHYVLQEPGEK